jgi:serine/threonine protein kinase
LSYFVLDGCPKKAAFFITNLFMGGVSMKKFISFILVFILVMSAFPSMSSSAATKQKFSDVPTDYWAYNEIQYLSDFGIIKGYSDDTFKPSKPVTRAQAAVMIARALNLSLENRQNHYYDIPSDFWAVKEITAVTEEGIFPVFEKFEPNLPLTRDIMAYVLTNAYYLPNFIDDLKFTDIDYSNKYRENIAALLSNRITTGYMDNTYRPKGTVTRAQFSVFMSRVLNPDFRKGTALNKELIYTLTDQEFKEAIALGEQDEEELKTYFWQNYSLPFKRKTYDAIEPMTAIVTPYMYTVFASAGSKQLGEKLPDVKTAKSILREEYPVELIYFLVETYEYPGEQKEDSVYIIQDHIQREPLKIEQVNNELSSITDPESGEELIFNSYLVAFDASVLDFEQPATLEVMVEDVPNYRVNTFEYEINFSDYQ